MAVGISDSRVCEEDQVFQAVRLAVPSVRLPCLTRPYRKLDDPAQITKDGESAKDLTKVYLSCLHEHFVSLLEKRLSSSVVKSTPMDFVVTVPAIWSPKAKQSTEQAAAMAGFCGNQRIQLISEPVGWISSRRGKCVANK